MLNVTGIGATPAEARERAYATAERIRFDGKQMRTDIALRAAERVEAQRLSDQEMTPVTETEVEHQFDDLDVDAPRVGIVMGSKSDMPS